MWRMQSGTRVLTKVERDCLAIGVEQLLEWITEDIASESDDMELGVAVFDRLTAEQKLLVLAETFEALCRPEIPFPMHTAANEATIAAMFESLRTAVIVEIDTTDELPDTYRTHVRRALLAVLRDDPAPSEDLPTADGADQDEWDWVIDAFSDRILWDADYEMNDDFLDLPPIVSDEVHEVMQVGDDYYTAVAAEPDTAALRDIEQRLRRLLR